MAVGRRRDVGRWGGECVGEGCVCVRGVCGASGDVYMHELQKVKCVTI